MHSLLPLKLSPSASDLFPPMTFEKISNDPSVRDCAACGRPTPVKEVDCIHCGRRPGEAAPDEIEAAKAVTDEIEIAKANRFTQALVTRTSPFTFIFIGANFAVFALEWLAGGMTPMSANSSVLIAMGAKYNALIDAQHQYWRFVTPLFIHIGFLHILFNNYALWIIGQEIERIYGSARFVILYLATGLVSTGASYYFTSDKISAGASGSIFGLFGVLAAFAVIYRKELPKAVSAHILRRIGPVLIINLALGFTVEIVDNAAHIGGLLSGIALAFIVPYKRLHEERTARVWRSLQVICLAAIFVSFVAAFRSYDGPRLSFRNLKVSSGEPVTAYFDGMRNATQLLSKSINSMVPVLNARDSSGDTKNAKDSVEQAIRTLDSIPPVNKQADEYWQRLLGLLIEQRNIIERYDESNSKPFGNLIADQNDLRKRYEQFQSELSLWLPDFLKQHGYRVESTDSDK